jgi:hypothetical protein
VRDRSAKLADPNLSLTELATTIGDLWFALNNCYTLNPRHRDEQRGKTQLDQVADRQPQILLINIGSNEGLFMAGFAGDFSDQTIIRATAIILPMGRASAAPRHRSPVRSSGTSTLSSPTSTRGLRTS